MTDKTDILISGCGIIGLTIARELLKKGYKDITILEKEESLGKHASGRNSGVLHAGIYYTSDSLKAKFCLEGNILMKDYCKEKHITVLETGKVIVAKNEAEIPVLKELYQRALKNNAKVEFLDKKQLKTIEPYAKTFELALFSPQTAVVDHKKVLESMETDLMSSGKVKILKGCELKGLKEKDKVITNKGTIGFNLLINTAGAYSDKIAHMFGIGQDYKIIPFKGTYKKLSKEKNYLVNGNIYPVPDIRNPFLGVHFTKAIDGTVFIGPTAIPAFGRENYKGLNGVNKEAFQILYRTIILFLKNQQLRKVVITEPKKYITKFFFEDAKNLVENINLEDIQPSSKAGIRPQLVDWKKKELVMDFIVLKHENSIHILNTISPGFTSSMAFAKFIVGKYVS